MMSFCQFIVCIFLIFLSGCSWFRSDKSDADSLLSQIEPVWYKIDPQIQLADWKGEIQPHLFYDAAPSWSPTTKQVNFIPLSVAGDVRSFEIDVISGQKYFSHFNCAQSDVWKERGAVKAKTNFTLGFIPRTFDQLNEPQRVIVFGGNGMDVDSARVYPVQIVSAFVEQICRVGRCSGPKDWIGRMVLVGVDPKNKEFSQIKDIAQLQKSINWKDVKGQLENLAGRNRSGDDDFPAIRAGNLLPLKEAMDFLERRTVKLDNKELFKLNRSCSKVYDLLWEKVGKKTFYDTLPQTKEDIKKYQTEVSRLRKLKRPIFFNERLGSFLKQYGSQFATCSRLVYMGNYNQDRERFRFMSWISMYVRLHKEGWMYDCARSSWDMENTGNKALKSFEKFYCSNKEIDIGMSLIPSVLKTLRLSVGERWRYVAWDGAAQGSHAKIYNWVKVPERHFACSNDKNEAVRSEWSEKMPDGNWEIRNDIKSIKDSGYIY